MPLWPSVASATRVTVSFSGLPGSRSDTVGGVQSAAAVTVLAEFCVWPVKVAPEVPGTPNSASPATSARTSSARGRRPMGVLLGSVGTSTTLRIGTPQVGNNDGREPHSRVTAAGRAGQAGCARRGGSGVGGLELRGLRRTDYRSAGHELPGLP